MKKKGERELQPNQIKMAKKTKNKIDWPTACTAIICLSILEICAMYYGINGTMRTIIFSLIALIVGIQMPQIKLNK